MDDNQCPARYDEHKRCALVKGHGGEHFAQWLATMYFDHDYRDPASAEYLD